VVKLFNITFVGFSKENSILEFDYRKDLNSISLGFCLFRYGLIIDINKS